MEQQYQDQNQELLQSLTIAHDQSFNANDLEQSNNFSITTLPKNSKFPDNSSVNPFTHMQEGPIPLIEFTKSNFKLNPEALNILRNIKENIIIVSVVGKARTGKSFLMNLLLNNNKNGFKVDSSLKSCTRGIWIWNSPKQKPNSSAKIIFIDSEGTNSVDISTKTNDSKIFALIVLISSLFIYNTTGNIDEHSISELALATHLSNSIAANSEISKDNFFNEFSTKFIWVLRDFTLEKIDPITGEEISSDEYLELCLKNKSVKYSNENNIIRKNIIKYFPERECVTLPRPVEEEFDLQNLSNIPFNKLKANFRTEFLSLKKKVYETSKPKVINNKIITGPLLADLLIAFIKSINSGNIPNINTAWDNVILSEIEKSFERSKNIWMQNIIEVNNNKNINPNEKIKILYEIKYYVINEYNNVVDENKEIKNNKNYFTKYKNYKEKLDIEINKDIKKEINDINKNNLLKLKKSINSKAKILDSDIFNNSSINNKNQEEIYNQLTNDYINLLKDMKDNIFTQNTKNIVDLVIKTDLKYTKDIISYINDNINNYYFKNGLKIEKELKLNEINDFCQNDKLKNLNNNLEKNYTLLKRELYSKNKEVTELIGKYTKLNEIKEEIIKKKNSFNTIRNSRCTDNRKTLKFSASQFYLESECKSCGCRMNKEECKIF